MSKIDLHIHTCESDGKYKPSEIVGMAAKAGVELMAVTDHDTINGIVPALEAVKQHPGLSLVPGVEISTDVPSGEVHVLGYFIDYKGSELDSVLSDMRNARVDRAQRMVKKLDKLGVHISFERVKELAGTGTVGRPHIAEAMLEKGYINNFKDAFNRYIGRGCPAYVEWEKMTPEMAVELVVRSHGLPVLAHPLTATNPESLVDILVPHGLAGIEAYYDDNSPEQIEWALALVRKHRLLATGGSDYHGMDETNEAHIGDAPVPDSVSEKLFACAREHNINIEN